jgi:hypothetical protein
MLPDTWAQAWSCGVVRARADDGWLPGAAREFLVSYGLPRVIIFEWRNDFEISFAPIGQAPVPYNAAIRWGDFYDADRDREWGRQSIIGVEEFCNGHASYCIQLDTGEVSRIDCELLEHPQSFVNASVSLFGMSLLAARVWSARIRSRRLVPTRDSYEVLWRDLERIDTRAFEHRRCFWRNLIEVVQDDEPIDMEISDDPSRSKPRFGERRA